MRGERINPYLIINMLDVLVCGSGWVTFRAQGSRRSSSLDITPIPWNGMVVELV